MKHVIFGATGRDLHIDQTLSQVAIDYRPDGMIADLIAPIVDVQHQSDLIPIFNREDILRIPDTARAPGTPANEVSRSVSSDSYFAKNYALSYPVTIEDRANADPIFMQKLFNGAAEFLVGKLALDWENRIASQVNSTSNVGSSAAVSSAWTDYTNSDPLSDVWTAIDNVDDSTGKKPNRVTFGKEAWRNFRRNTTVRNLIFGTNNGGGLPSTQQVADLLEVDQVLVGAAMKNTAAEGQTETLARVWTDNVLVSYSPMSPSIMEPSFMYSFRWNVPGVPSMQGQRHPFDSVRKRELTEVGYYQDEKITGSDYSFLITAVTSST